jgi:hypothetical protein
LNNKISTMRTWIPVMPLWMAIVLLIVNIFIPGLGTMLAGFFVLCELANLGDSSQSRVESFCANFWVGVLQMLLASIVLGWIWAIFWGILFVTQSTENYGRASATGAGRTSYSTPGAGVGGTSYSSPAAGVGGTSYSSPSAGVGGTSYSSPAAGVGGTSYSSPAAGVGSTSYASPAHAPSAAGTTAGSGLSTTARSATGGETLA